MMNHDEAITKEVDSCQKAKTKPLSGRNNNGRMRVRIFMAALGKVVACQACCLGQDFRGTVCSLGRLTHVHYCGTVSVSTGAAALVLLAAGRWGTDVVLFLENIPAPCHSFMNVSCVLERSILTREPTLYSLIVQVAASNISFLFPLYPVSTLEQSNN